MRILILHPDPSALGALQSMLEAQGHQIITESDVSRVKDHVQSNLIHVAMIDRLMDPDMRALIVSMRRQSTKSYPYTFLIGVHQTEEDAIAAGANQGLSLPLKPERLQAAMADALRVSELITRLADGSEDFPSAGGVIAKSAFNQLFLAAMDRADRYGDPSYIIFIRLQNYFQIRDLDGPHAADFAASKMAQHLVRIRRQSDIIAQTGKHEYALLLMRPDSAQEPVDAAARFADTLAKCSDIAFSPMTGVEIVIQVLTIPTGALAAEHRVTIAGQ